MDTFGKILKSSIDTLDLSINKFSKISGINRGQLYNIFSGIKNISEEKFENMLSSFNFNNSQKHALKESYYRDVYGNDDFDKIQYIITSLNKLSDKEKSNEALDQTPLILKSDFKELTFEQKNISILISNIIRYESEKDCPKVLTNFPFSFNYLDDAVYNAIFQCKVKFDFKHIVNFYESGKGIHNLRNLFQSVKYLKLKYNCWYYYSHDENNPSPDNAFPYYFICSDYLVLIDNYCSVALLITERNAINAHFSLLNKSISECTPLAFFPTNALEFKDKVASMALTKDWTHLSYFPCVVTNFTPKILREIGQDNLENSEWLINIALNHFSALTSSSNKSYLVQCEGLKQFAKDGKSYEIPGEYIKIFPPHLKRKILESNVEDINLNKISFNLINDEKLILPKQLAFMSFKSNVLIMMGYFSEEIDKRYYGEFSVTLYDNILSNDWKNFEEYLIKSNYCHSKEFIDYLLNELIFKLEQT